MTQWATTVDRLMLTFRDALRAIIPHLERAKIDWRDDSAYDDWDAIAQVLYEKIVVASLMWALPEDDREHYRIPDYSTMYSSYEGRARITVNSTSSGQAFVFHSFATDREPFDRVRTCRVNDLGVVMSADFTLFDADEATYKLQTPRMMLSDITIDV